MSLGVGSIVQSQALSLEPDPCAHEYTGPGVVDPRRYDQRFYGSYRSPSGCVPTLGPVARHLPCRRFR